jgi:hypothetical protein
MNILSNSTTQSLITDLLALAALLLGILNMVLKPRRFVEIPLQYETLSLELLDAADEEGKALLATLQIIPDEKFGRFFTLITCKIRNSGNVFIQLPDDIKLVFVAFRKRTILACRETDKSSPELEYTYRLAEDRVLLTFPLLRPKESVTLQIVMLGSVFELPDVDVRVPQKRDIVVANNIRRSKESCVLGIFLLIAGIYLFISSWSIPSLLGKGVILLSLFGGIVFLLLAWFDRKSPPIQHILPSQYFLVLGVVILIASPVLLVLGLIALFIYARFGSDALRNAFLLFMCLCTTWALWWMANEWVSKFLQWRKKTHNRVLVGVLATIPSLLFIGLWVRVLLLLWLHI